MPNSDLRPRPLRTDRPRPSRMDMGRRPERELVQRHRERPPSYARSTRASAVGSSASQYSSHHDHVIMTGPPLGFNKATLDRVGRILKTPGALNSILAVLQHLIKFFLHYNPQYMESLKRPGGRRINFEQLRLSISDFRQFLALGDLIGVYKTAQKHHAQRAEMTEFNRLIGWIKIAGFTGYSLFEGLEWLASKGIYKAHSTDHGHVRRASHMLRISCWSYMVAIFATFIELGTGKEAIEKLRRIPKGLRKDTHKSREWKEKRAAILRTLLGATFWAPVCYDLGLKRQPLGGKVNSFFTMLAHGTNVTGAWAGSHASKVKGPGQAGTLSAKPVKTVGSANKKRASG